MEQLLQQALGLARTLGDALKAQAMAAAPEPLRNFIDAAPSLLVLLIGAFVALVVLQLVLSMLLGGGRKQRAAREREIDAALAQARRADAREGRPVERAARAERRADVQNDQRQDRQEPRVAAPPPLPPTPPELDEANARGDHALMIGDVRAARAAFEDAERVARTWASRAPSETSLRGLARTLVRLAETRQKAGEAQDARQVMDEAVATVRAMVRNASQDPSVARELAVTLERAGALAAGRGDKAAARQAWEEELAIANRLAAQPGADASWQRFIAVVHVMVGNLGDSDAYMHYDRALRHFDKFAQASVLSPDDAHTCDQLRAALGRV